MTEIQLIRKLGLNAGDTIVVPKSSLKLVQHFAVYLGADEFDNHYMCENIIGIGVKLTRVSKFFSGSPSITRIEKFSGTYHDRKILVQKALSRLGQPYDLINYNCETFSNDVRYNVMKSAQTENAFALAFCIGFIALILAASNSK